MGSGHHGRLCGSADAVAGLLVGQSRRPTAASRAEFFDFSCCGIGVCVRFCSNFPPIPPPSPLHPSSRPQIVTRDPARTSSPSTPLSTLAHRLRLNCGPCRSCPCPPVCRRPVQTSPVPSHARCPHPQDLIINLYRVSSSHLTQPPALETSSRSPTAPVTIPLLPAPRLTSPISSLLPHIRPTRLRKTLAPLPSTRLQPPPNDNPHPPHASLESAAS